jgi:hypothetical protein
VVTNLHRYKSTPLKFVLRMVDPRRLFHCDFKSAMTSDLEAGNWKVHCSIIALTNLIVRAKLKYSKCRDKELVEGTGIIGSHVTSA